MKNKVKELYDLIKKRHYLRRILILLISMFISALIFNFFQKEVNLVTGGASGLALIISYLTGYNTSEIITVIMFLFLILSFIFLGFETTSGTIIASISYPFFVKLTEYWPNYVSVDTSDLLLISIFIGVAMGVTNGLVFKNGFNNGGTAVLSQILYKYRRISISTTSFIMNMIIVGVGGIFFGWNIVMYSTIILYINSIVLDRILIGISKYKFVYIITSEEEQAKKFIIDQIKRGITELEAQGGLKFNKKKVLMTVIPTSDYFKLKAVIKKIDNKAFMIVTDSYQVYNGK